MKTMALLTFLFVPFLAKAQNVCVTTHYPPGITIQDLKINVGYLKVVQLTNAQYTSSQDTKNYISQGLLTQVSCFLPTPTKTQTCNPTLTPECANQFSPTYTPTPDLTPTNTPITPSPTSTPTPTVAPQISAYSSVVIWGDDPATGDTTGIGGMAYYLKQMLGCNVINNGGVQISSNMIAIRQGAITETCSLYPSGILPKYTDFNSPTLVQFSGSNPNPMNSYDVTNLKCSIAGVSGNVSFGPYGSTCTFIRDQPGKPQTIAGQIPFIVNTLNAESALNIFYQGCFDVANSQPASVLMYVTEEVAHLSPGTPFIVLPVTKTASQIIGSAGYTIVQNINASLQAAFPNNYLDTQEYLISQYDPNLPQDVTDNGNDIIPTSLSAGLPSLGNPGYALMAQCAVSYIHAKGWITSAPDIQTLTTRGLGDWYGGAPNYPYFIQGPGSGQALLNAYQSVARFSFGYEDYYSGVACGYLNLLGAGNGATGTQAYYNDEDGSDNTFSGHGAGSGDGSFADHLQGCTGAGFHNLLDIANGKVNCDAFGANTGVGSDCDGCGFYGEGIGQAVTGTGVVILGAGGLTLINGNVATGAVSLKGVLYTNAGDFPTSGVVTLGVGGTAAVTNLGLDSNSQVFITAVSFNSGTPGFVAASTAGSPTSIINFQSSSVADTSIINWYYIN